MKTKLIVISFITTVFVLCGANEIPLKSKIRSLGLFKNGLAVVTRTIKVDSTGSYIITDVPEPVHGTFWIESDALVTTRITAKKIKEQVKPGNLSFKEITEGEKVKIHFNGGLQPMSCQILFPEPEKKQKWNRTYHRNPPYHYWYHPRLNQNINPPKSPLDSFLKLKHDNGITLISSSKIDYIQTENIKKAIQRIQPVMVFDVKNLSGDSATISISYLTKGISWAPSYKVNILNTKELSLEQKAVIKNEFADFKDANVQLISGFPNIKFAHVTSPLSLKTNWSAFFQQLNQRIMPGHASTSNVMTQQAVMYNRPTQSNSGIDLSAATEKSTDIHYQDMGKLSMSEGDSLALSIIKKNTGYEKIVEWDIPDTRTPDGRYIQDYERRQNPEKYRDSAWDSLRFKNPFSFPMTTGPAIIMEKGKFLGQSLSFWVNPDSETVLNITKALSISVRSTEQEIPGKRERLMLAGTRYQKTKVKGTLSVENHRDKAVKILIRRCFSGELISADGNHKNQLREEGVYSINKRNELTWELTIAPGKKNILTYTYEVLVRI